MIKNDKWLAPFFLSWLRLCFRLFLFYFSNAPMYQPEIQATYVQIYIGVIII